MSVPRAVSLGSLQRTEVRIGSLRTTNPTIPLLVHGQGTFLFTTTSVGPPCVFQILTKDGTDGLEVEWTLNDLHVTLLTTFEPLIDPKCISGLINKSGATYWFSLDSHNGTLYAGIGEARMETAIYHYVFPYDTTKFLESLVQITCVSTTLVQLRLLRDPITMNIPLCVKSTNTLTMNDVASGRYLPNANLSSMAQKLYNCISGKAFVLDDDDFPDFSKAIEQSIRTPSGWCYKRLAEKANEFSKEPHPQETYLRITLGANNGESPGVPYVMEIWPVGHYSPIHSHSNANAVIRVLHGQIQVELYPFLCDEKDGIDPFAVAHFNKDDITWISPTLNQVHRLTNLVDNIEACITIQCYMYNEDDDAHYDYFDYLGDNGKKLQYTPDSDMDFVKFKELMKQEWISSLGC